MLVVCVDGTTSAPGVLAMGRRRSTKLVASRGERVILHSKDVQRERRSVHSASATQTVVRAGEGIKRGQRTTFD